jgi:cobalt-zinc-cadmium efflux system protein
MASDLAAFVATVIAGGIVWATGFQRADALASLVVVGLMILASVSLLREAGGVLMQGSPPDLDLADLRRRLLEVPHVLEVHDLHAWLLGSRQTTLAAHVVVEDHCFESGHAPMVLDDLQACVGTEFGIPHATFQLEPVAHQGHEDDVHP